MKASTVEEWLEEYESRANELRKQGLLTYDEARDVRTHLSAANRRLANSRKAALWAEHYEYSDARSLLKEMHDNATHRCNEMLENNQLGPEQGVLVLSSLYLANFELSSGKSLDIVRTALRRAENIMNLENPPIPVPDSANSDAP
jgi:hypothetical protein